MTSTIENQNSYSMESLQWLIEAGADEAISDAPINRFETSAKTQAIPQNDIAPKNTTPMVNTVQNIQEKAKQNAPQESLGTSQAIDKANEICKLAITMDDITKAIQKFDGCPSLKNTANNTIVYCGAEKPTVLCIGNHPSRNDDTNNMPFFGDTGTLLKRMFSAIGQTDMEMGYSNAVFWYPPGGRSISLAEFTICKIFLNKIIEILQPKFLVLLGGETCSATIGTTGGIGKLHGKIHTYTTTNGLNIPCMPLHHPDYILQTPVSKPIIWEDLKLLKQHLLSV